MPRRASFLEAWRRVCTRRKLMMRDRDAALSTSFGANTLVRFDVVTDEVPAA